MKQKQEHSSVITLFSVFLLLLFVSSALLLILFGSRVYQNGARHLNENYTNRTAIAYVTEKVRQHEETGSISLQELDSIPALRLQETLNGDSFYTFIYFYDHALRELFLQSDRSPSPEMGSTIVELSDFSISENAEGFLTVTAVSQEGRSLSTLIYPGSSLTR